MNKYIDVMADNIRRETVLGILLAITASVLAAILFVVSASYLIILTISTGGLTLLAIPVLLAAWVYWEANKDE